MEDSKILELLQEEQRAEVSKSLSNLVRTCEEHGVCLADAQRRLDGLAKVAERHESRLQSIDLDRDAMRKAFDTRFEEIVKAYRDAETAFTERLAQMAQHNLGLSKHNANLKRDIGKLKGGDK